ncbi:MAG: aromatic amino acid lyase, partial [Phycisphaerales bacterium]
MGPGTPRSEERLPTDQPRSTAPSSSPRTRIEFCSADLSIELPRRIGTSPLGGSGRRGGSRIIGSSSPDVPSSEPNVPRSTASDDARPPGSPPATSRAVLVLDGGPLSIEDVEAVAVGRSAAVLGSEGRHRLATGRAGLERALSGGRAIYGVNTGFGSLARVRLEGEHLAAMQSNLVRSHASGVGPPLPREIVRAMMLVLAASLTRGHSGVRPIVVEHLLAMLEADLVPVVPSRGSVGASGDLAPLAHVALPLLGEGAVEMCGR